MKTKRKSKTDDKDVHCVSGNLDEKSEENSKSKTKNKKIKKEIKQEIKKEIKQEIKIEPVDENVDKGSNNDETENRISIKKEKKLEIITELSLLDVTKNEDCMILTKMLEMVENKKKK